LPLIYTGKTIEFGCGLDEAEAEHLIEFIAHRARPAG
jgi:hypothetical protein